MPYDDVGRLLTQSRQRAEAQRRKNRTLLVQPTAPPADPLLDDALKLSAPSPEAVGPTDPLLDDALRVSEPKPEASWGDLGVTSALRIIPPTVGGILGGGIGPTAAVGGGLGTLVGEPLAQAYEVARGLRPGFSGKEIAAETAINAALSTVPGGSTVRRAALMGAGMGAAGEAARGVLTEGEVPELSRLLVSGGLGTVFGAGTKLAGDKLARVLAARAEPVVTVEPAPSPPRVPPAPSPVSRLTPEQEYVDRIVNRSPATGRPIDPNRVAPQYRGVRTGMVEGEPWGGWPGPVGPEEVTGAVVQPRPARRLLTGEVGIPPAEPIPQPPSSQAPRALLPPAEPQGQLPVEPMGGRPGPEIGDLPFALKRGVVPAQGRPLPLPLDETALVQDAMRLSTPVAEAPPVEAPGRVPGEDDVVGAVAPRLRVTMRAGQASHAADVEFARPELEELFRAGTRVSGKGAKSGKVSDRLAKLKAWIEGEHEVELKSRGDSGLNAIAVRYRKAVLDAVKNAKPGETVRAPDLELLLPEPKSVLRSMYRQARQEGYEGSPDELKQIAALEEATAEADDPDAGGASPLAFLRAVANVGGIRHSPGAMYSEVTEWLRDLAASAYGPGAKAKMVASIRSKPGSKRYAATRARLEDKFAAGQFLPEGRVAGIPVYSVSGHRSMDSLAEALQESYPQFFGGKQHEAETVNARDVADMLQDYVGRVHASPPEKPFGPRWWARYAGLDLPGRQAEFEGRGYPPDWDVTDVSPGGIEPQPNAPVSAAGLELAAGETGTARPGAPAGAEPPARPAWGSEAGAASNQLVSTLSGGLTGAAYGGATGDTPEERLKRAAVFGALGAAGGMTLSGLSRRPAPRAPTAPEVAPGARPSPLAGVPAGVPAGRPVVPGQERMRGRAAESTWAPIPKAGTIKPERLPINLSSLPASIQGDTQALLEDLNYLQRHRRGVQSHARTQELSKRIVVEMDRVLPAGTALNAETKLAYANAYARVTRDTQDLSKRIAADKTRGVVNDQDLFDLARLKAQERALFMSWRGSTTEAGRALEAEKIMKSMLPWERQIYMAAQRKGASAQKLEDLAVKLSQTDDPYTMFAEAARGQDQAWNETVQSYFLTNVLSGVATQLRNGLGNGANLIFKNSVVPALRVPVDVAWSRITGEARQVFAGDVAQRWIGMQHALGGALADAGHVLKNGFSRLQVDDMIAAAEGIDLGRREFRGGGANIFNWVGRGMDAADRFFLALNKGAAERAYVYNKALAALKGRGAPIDADTLAREMAQQKVVLADDKAGRMEVMREALEGVYREPLGATAQRLQLLKSDVPGMGYIIPFVKTVSNIFRQGYEHTPLSLAVKGLKAHRAKSMEPFGATRGAQEMMLAKGLFGTAATLPLAYLGATGQISGNGPTDPAQRQQLMDTGWRPNSILLPLPEEMAKSLGASRSDTGRYWVNYALFQPLSIPMSIAANAFEAVANVERSREKATVDVMPTREMAQALSGVAKSGLAQSYLNGLFNLVEAVQSDASASEKFISQLIKGFVPLSGLVRGVARTTDPFVRKPRGVLQSIAADIPTFSEDVPTRTGRYGEPIQRERPAWARGWLVPEIEGQRADPIDTELTRLGVYLPRPMGRVELRNRAGELRKLSQADENMAETARGVSRRAVLAQVMQSPAYERQTDLVKRLLVRRALNQASRFGSEAARVGIARQDPALFQALLARPRQIAAASRRKQP